MTFGNYIGFGLAVTGFDCVLLLVFVADTTNRNVALSEFIYKSPVNSVNYILKISSVSYENVMV